MWTFWSNALRRPWGNLSGQIEDLQEGMQGSSVHAVSHKKFMAFQDKVLSVLTRLESRVNALRRNVED